MVVLLDETDIELGILAVLDEAPLAAVLRLVLAAVDATGRWRCGNIDFEICPFIRVGHDIDIAESVETFLPLTGIACDGYITTVNLDIPRPTGNREA